MNKKAGLVLLVGVLLSGCSMSGHPESAAVTAIKGVYTDNSNQYGYIKSFPLSAGSPLSTEKLRQCVLATHAAQSLVPAADGYSGQTTYTVNRMGSPVPFVVNFTLQVSETASQRHYVFSRITQTPEDDKSATSGAWVTANPAQVVGTFNNVSADLNRCLSNPE
ncbi:hypothetical protein GCM10009414_33570 [Tatumella terrea]|uniref:hypothetical protein n=1 Tax=Tatumella terrea TaxID=419007 RepID=UPI0031D138E0